MTAIRDYFYVKRRERTPYILIILWVSAMIALPIMRWVYGETIMPTAVTIALVLQLIAVCAVLINTWSMTRTLMVVGVIVVGTWIAEYVGSSTGFPFGSYYYTDLLQPQIGHVPIIVPIAWFMMLPSSWAIAESIVGRNRPIVYIVIGTLAMTAWDLFLDPQMVAWGFWVWEGGGAYFGIPLVNYAGWLLTAGVLTVVLRPYRWELPVRPLITIYAVVWFLQTVGLAVFWGQVGPALFGSLAMGYLLFRAIKAQST